MEPMEDLKAKLLTDLKEFPNSFHLDRCPVKLMRKVKKTLSSQREEDPVPFYEIIDENLMSFLEMQLGGQENILSAEKRNQKVRESDPGNRNIVALANYANMLIRSEDLARAKRTVDKLKSLKTRHDFAEQVTNAKAELAYSYSKLGPRYHGQAKRIYEEVLGAYPGQWQWKYRYGVVLQRCLNAESYIDDKDFDASDTFIKGFRVLREVTSCPDADKTTTAQAWTKIGSLIFSYGGVPSVYKKADESAKACLLEGCSETAIDTGYCMQEAIKLAPEDRTVLQEYGRFFRRGKTNRNFEKARHYLQKSYDIHPTTFNCLHLGLLDVDEWKEEAFNKKKRTETVKKQLSFDHCSSTEEQKGSHERDAPGGASFRERPCFSLDSGSSSQQGYEFTSATSSAEEQRVSRERDAPGGASFRERPSFSLDSGYSSQQGCEFTSATAELTNRFGDLSVTSSNELDSQYSQLNDVGVFITYVLRSPKYLKKEYDPSNALLTHAIKMFEEASELCEHTAVQVHYSKGLAHRRLNSPAEALKCFKVLSGIEACSLFMKVNSYEQQGYCYVELAEQEVNPTKKTENVEDAIVMFFFAIDNAVRLSLPFHYECPSSLSLQDLLVSKSRENPRHPEPQKKLTRLYELLGQHSLALKYLDEVLKLDPNDSNAYLKKASLLMSQGKCEEAVNLLMMLLTTVHREHVLHNKHVLVDAAVAAAEGNLRKGKEDIAREYFLRAYQTVFGMEGIESPDVYEIYITGQESDDSCLFHHFSQIITRYFGLSCICANDIPPGEYGISYSSGAMEESRNMLFVFSDAGLLTRKSKHLIEAALLCVQQKPCEGLYSISAAGDLPQSLQYVKLNQVPSYSSWKDAQKDSPEFVDLVASLFRGIITTAC